MILPYLKLKKKIEYVVPEINRSHSNINSSINVYSIYFLKIWLSIFILKLDFGIILLSSLQMISQKNIYNQN